MGSAGTAADKCGAVISWTTPTATDNCAGTVNVICTPASGSTFNLGQTTVSCTTTDTSGNSSSCRFTVTVNDTEPPNVTCPTNRTAACTGTNGAQVFFAPTAMDNCDPNVTVSCTPPSGSFFLPGTNTVTCTATDASGNSSNCTFTVTVADPTPPVLSIQLQDRNVLICWPTTCTSYVLQQTTDLMRPINWSAVAAPVMVRNDRYCVTLPIGSGNRFFRLNPR